MLIHVERLEYLGEGEVLKTTKGAGGFLFLFFFPFQHN